VIKIEITQSNNRNLEDFVEISDIRENPNGVIDIDIESPRFKYWDVYSGNNGGESGSCVDISCMIEYHKGTLYRIEDWEDVPEDEIEFETFCFDVVFDEEEKNEWDYYEVYITSLKYQYEIKLVPRSLLKTYGENGKELDWEEIVIVSEEEMKNES